MFVTKRGKQKMNPFFYVKNVSDFAFACSICPLPVLHLSNRGVARGRFCGNAHSCSVQMHPSDPFLFWGFFLQFIFFTSSRSAALTHTVACRMNGFWLPGFGRKTLTISARSNGRTRAPSQTQNVTWNNGKIDRKTSRGNELLNIAEVLAKLNINMYYMHCCIVSQISIQQIPRKNLITIYSGLN